MMNDSLLISTAVAQARTWPHYKKLPLFPLHFDGQRLDPRVICALYISDTWMMVVSSTLSLTDY